MLPPDVCFLISVPHPIILNMIEGRTESEAEARTREWIEFFLKDTKASEEITNPPLGLGDHTPALQSTHAPTEAPTSSVDDLILQQSRELFRGNPELMKCEKPELSFNNQGEYLRVTAFLSQFRRRMIEVRQKKKKLGEVTYDWRCKKQPGEIYILFCRPQKTAVASTTQFYRRLI